MESQAHTIASGFAHSCAIGAKGELFVWGDNTNEQLADKAYAHRGLAEDKKHSNSNHGEGAKGNIIPEPLAIKLQYKIEKSETTGAQQGGNINVNAEAAVSGSDYKATDVAAGPFCTFVIGVQQMGKTFIQVEEPEIQEILDSIQKILLKHKTLINLFYGNNSAQNQDDWGGSFEDAEESYKFRILLQQDPFTLEIPKETFIEKLIQAGICSTDQFQKAEDLARIIKEHREKSHEAGAGGQSSDDCLILGDIEDFALGFLQNNIKLFLFGQAHKALRSFERETDEMSELLRQGLPESEVNKKGDHDDANEAKVAPKPIAIVFPKFTKPLISVAVGSAHALALTIEFEMYSWGAGIYGALGFGEQEDCTYPRRLDIKDHKNQSYKITQICCGKFHSMCLTSRQNIFSWGDASQGRLGHGDVYTDDQLAPKEIYTLSQRKPVFIAAGESHSAAITEKHQLFTWGNGGFGRLGHGSDNKETSPKLVEQLQDYEIVQVSLGSLHTLAVTSQGLVFSFGQNKYGKLGIHYSNSKDGQIHKEPVKISMYFWTDEGPKPSKKKNDIIQVAAGFNHSLALSREGKAYSWGYKGKGQLGRLGGDNRLALPVGASQQGSTAFHNSLTQERQALMRNYLKMKQGELSDTLENPIIELDKCQKLMVDQTLEIKQLCCGSANTVALTSLGEVYVLGNNLYGQHAREEIKVAPIPIETIEGVDPQYEEYDLNTNVSLIRFPFQTLDKVQYIACGGEHLFAQSVLDEIYAWGRNDEGQLGIGFLSNKVTEPFLIKDLSYKGIKQISCGDNYSAAVTVYGEVFVAGSQEGGKLGLGKGQRRGYQLNFKYLQKLPEIDYVCCGVDHMLAISRKTDDPKSGSTFAWGKNHRGQLGIGSKDNQYSPCEIMTKEKLQKVCCGFDFSLGLSFTNKIYFWGNFNSYCQTQKLHTKDIDEPTVIQVFENNTVLDIACNYMQSYALVDKGEIKKWGKFVQEKEQNKRGLIKQKKNNKDDGGDESEIVLCTPTTVKCSLANSKTGVQFESIVTGENHSCAISTAQKAYVWGYNNVNNRLGVRNLMETEAAKALEPQEIGTLQDIMDHQREHANGNHHGHDHSSIDEHEADSFGMEDDGQSGFEDNLVMESQREMAEELKGMDEEEVDTVDPEEVELEEQYNNQTSVEQQNQEQTIGGKKKTPAGGGASKMQGAGKQELKQAAAGGALTKQGYRPPKNGQINSGDFCEMFLAQVEAYNQRVKKDKASKGKVLNVFDQNVDLYTLEFIRQEIQTKQSPNLVNLLKSSGFDLIKANILLQKILKKESQQGLDEETISDLDYDISKTTARIILQVAQFSKFQSQNNGLILTSKTSFLGRAVENPFNIDIALSHQLKYKGMDPPIVKHKKALQQIFTLFVTHPCYIVRLLKSDLLHFDDQKLLIKQLFSSGKKTITLRNNYFLISIFDQMLQHDLKGKKLQQVNLLDPDSKMISVYIFKRVFKSRQTNLETVSSIAAHILNLILALSQGQGGAGEDDTLDVLNETGGNAGGPGDKGGQATEKPTGGTTSQKATALQGIVIKVIEAILNNLVLRENAQYFAFKKKTAAQLDFIKKQFKDFQEERVGQSGSAKQSQAKWLAGIEHEKIKDKFPSLRFSQEITVMVEILDRQLRSLDSASGSKDEDVCNQVLGLIFNPNLHKIKENLPLYIYPFLSKVKMVNFVGEQLQEIHATNIKNAFITVINYMNGQPVFKQGSTENESWNQILNQKLLQHQQTYKIKILNQILKYGAEVDSILSYKNFENLVAHCLEQDDTKISISKKLVGIIYQRLAEYTNEIVIFSPAKNDPMFKIVQNINADKKKQQQKDKESLQSLAKIPDYAERVNLKLKTRLMIQDSLESAQIEKFVRCTNCHATLQSDVAVQNYDENIVLSQYEPQGAQNLVTAFCEVLRNVEEINPDLLSGGQQKKDDNVGLFEQGSGNQIKGGMKEFIRITAQTAKREAKHKKSKMIQDFETNLEIEVDGLKNKNQVKGRADDNARDIDMHSEMDLTDEVFRDLLYQAEKKMNDRIRQKFNLKLIQVHIERHLKPMIQAKISSFKNHLMDKNQLKSDNYQWGLANRDLLHLWDTPNLIQMNRVRAFTIGQKMSQSLNKNLGSEQKQNIRGYLQIDCKKLLENGTIRKARLVELEPMLPMCHCVLIESDRGQQVEFKLVFRQTKYNPCGANKVLQEQILLSFNISPQKLKSMRQQKAKESAMSTKNGDEEQEGLVFEENDALEFDPDGFLKLLTQMERQKAAYSLLEENNDGTTSSKKRKSKSRKK